MIVLVVNIVCYRVGIIKRNLGTTLGMNLSEEIELIRTMASSLLRHATAPTPLIHSEELLAELNLLEKEITSVLKNKKSLRQFVPRMVLRHWAVASFWMALKKITASRKYSSRDDKRFVQQAQFAALWAYQGCDLVTASTFVKKILNNLDTFTLYSSHLEKGDVVLSYKSNQYLKHDILAKLISITTNSHITHTLMVSDSEVPQHLLSANPRSAGIGLDKVAPHKGEMFIIMRYRSGINSIPKEKIIESMDSIYNPKMQDDKKLSFAELKSWVACGIGFIYTMTIVLFERPLCLPNPVKKDSTIFCSEFVDAVFRRADAYLSPRSENPAVLGPAELFYSPLLEFKGVIFRPEDREMFIKQVSKTFTLLCENIEEPVAGSSSREWVCPGE